MTLAVTPTGNLARLDPLTTEHARALAAAATEPCAAYLYTAVPADAGAAVTYIAAALARQARGEAVPYAITDLSRGHVVRSTRYLDRPTGPRTRRLRAPLRSAAPGRPPARSELTSTPRPAC